METLAQGDEEFSVLYTAEQPSRETVPRIPLQESVRLVILQHLVKQRYCKMGNEDEECLPF